VPGKNAHTERQRSVPGKDAQEQRCHFVPDKDAQEQRHRLVPGNTKEQPSKRSGTRDGHELARDGLGCPPPEFGAVDEESVLEGVIGAKRKE
jgi:hypothetical protein